MAAAVRTRAARVTGRLAPGGGNAPAGNAAAGNATGGSAPVEDETTQFSLEDTIKRYDELRSEKKFPDELVQADYKYYTSFYPKGAPRHDIKAQFLNRYRDAASVAFSSKVESVVRLDSTTAYVQITTQVRESVPMRMYVPVYSGSYEADNVASQASHPTAAVRYVRTGGVWDYQVDGWRLRREWNISSLAAVVKEPSDPSEEGEAWPEPLPAPAEILEARLAGLDEARSRGDFGKYYTFSNFDLDPQGDGDSSGNLSRLTAESRFKRVYSRMSSLRVTTEVKEAVQYSSFHILAIVERRYTWRNATDGATVTAVRTEADFWQKAKEPQEWYIEQTRYLSQAPILTYAGL